MIKPRCENCKRIYLGESCSCERKGRYRKLQCECGQPAEEVWLDDLGEWPLCADCLQGLGQEGAPGARVAEREGWTGDEDKPDGFELPLEYPFGLTRRQYEIAMLSNLSSQEIADRLTISENTVQSHMKLIFKKLNVRSRHEIQHVLHSQGDDPFKSSRNTQASMEDRSMVTVTITFTERKSNLQDVLDRLFDDWS